jgi:hypothetical protein
VRPLRAAICAGLAAGAAAAVAPPPAAAAPSCAATGSRTVFANPVARIFYTRAGRPYSCYRITGRRVPLDMFVDRFYAPGDARLGHLRMTGRILAYTWVDPGIPAVYVHSVDMRVARFWRRVKVAPPTSAEPSSVRVNDLVARRSGAIGWIQRVDGEVSVWRFDARGRRRLDVSPLIAPVSLRLVGGRLTWERDGVPRSASLL